MGCDGCVSCIGCDRCTDLALGWVKKQKEVATSVSRIGCFLVLRSTASCDTGTDLVSGWVKKQKVVATSSGACLRKELLLEQIKPSDPQNKTHWSPWMDWDKLFLTKAPPLLLLLLAPQWPLHIETLLIDWHIDYSQQHFMRWISNSIWDWWWQGSWKCVASYKRRHTLLIGHLEVQLKV